jgi:hypothetical protein
VVAVYGDTHVDPVQLFDPGRGQAPPADALDLYFHAPLSLSLVGDAFAHNRSRMDQYLDQLLNLYAGLAGGIIRDVQRQGGYVTGGHRDRAIPARLEITAVAHNEVPGQATMRLHTHIYVGRTAAALSLDPRTGAVGDLVLLRAPAVDPFGVCERGLAAGLSSSSTVLGARAGGSGGGGWAVAGDVVPEL